MSVKKKVTGSRSGRGDLHTRQFGPDFTWGTAISSYQTEGYNTSDGKSFSIWDRFVEQHPKITGHQFAEKAVEFYVRFPPDLDLLKEMNFSALRFSLSWPRILPGGTGTLNRKGIDYYNRLIDACLQREITPWITLYHWDLPQVLETNGGWTNRDMIAWFSEYAAIASRAFGDRVKNWMVLNEPLAFTALGYLIGRHAPGRRGLRNFLPAMHHAAICQAEGARIIRKEVKSAHIGSTFSCSLVKPNNKNLKDQAAAAKLDAALNRLFLEPALGMGYPFDALPMLKRVEKYIRPGDMEKLPFEFDFIGIQYYFRIVAAHSWVPPFHIREIPARKRTRKISEMEYEVHTKGIYKILKKFTAYKTIPKLIVTESGVCYPDSLTEDGKIHDKKRVKFFIRTLKQIRKARNKGIPVEGYFVWSLTDNFEWTEGTRPRFGLVHVDYQTQTRIMKDSGKWFRSFLNAKKG